MTIISIIIFLFLGIVLLFYFLMSIDSLLGYCDLPTTKRATNQVLEIISEYKKQSGIFYDLGCAKGELAIAVKKRFPQLTVYGIEKNGLRILRARLKAFFLRKKIFFQKKSILDVDLRNADIVYIYLKQSSMNEIGKKLEKELKDGALVITNTTFFPDWQPIKTYITYPKQPRFEKIFVYIYEKSFSKN